MVPPDSPHEFWKTSFAAPRVIRLDRPLALLAGGLSRLYVSLSGWGRVTVAFHEVGGRQKSSSRFFIGCDVPYIVDIRPPGVLSISVTNIFGSDSGEWSLPTEGKIPGSIHEPKVCSFPVFSQIPSHRFTMIPKVARLDPYQLRLPPSKIPTNFLELEK